MVETNYGNRRTLVCVIGGGGGAIKPNRKREKNLKKKEKPWGKTPGLYTGRKEQKSAHFFGKQVKMVKIKRC